ncbi:cob(I)yrinic acid a,c-diamide adenosyltransferase [Patescibacteria group bacterium]|nr:cob(I)yrinic acid a,c-diamide adenosyltransferase [Patescibacteria group bacterium]
MPIYTKTGDTGSTSLFGGKRVLKCEELVDVYGSIDELNSWVGKVGSDIDSPDVQTFLSSVQSDLFTIGSHLAGWKADLKDLPRRVKEMEERIDVLDDKLPKLTNFILPGGNRLASDIHLARAVCRRVERQTVALGQKEKVDPKIFIYLNRLSDLFFMLARFINHEAGIVEVTWQGIDRSPEKQ